MMNLSNYINQVKKMLDEKVNLLKLKNVLLKVNELDNFLNSLDTDLLNINIDNYKDNLLLIESEKEVESDLSFLNSIKELAPFLSNPNIEETGIKKVILDKLDNFKLKIKTKQKEKQELLNKQIKELEDIITKYTKLKNYLDNLENEFSLNLTEIKEFMDLIELLDAPLVEKLELVTLISQKGYHNIKNHKVEEESPITRENIHDLISQTESNEQIVIKELDSISTEKDETLEILIESRNAKEQEEKDNYSKKLEILKTLQDKAITILREHQTILNIYHSFNDGIKHYLMNGDFLSIEQANPHLNMEEIKTLSIIIPCLKDLEYYLEFEADAEIIDDLINELQNKLEEYQKKVLIYNETRNQEIEILEPNNQDFEDFIANSTNIILFSKELEQEDFYIDQDLISDDTDKQVVKKNELREAINLFTKQGYADNIRIHSNTDKLYKNIKTKLYDKELSPYRIRNTNYGRTGYLIIPTCEENMQKIAELYHNQHFANNGNGRIVLFFSVTWTDAAHNEYDNLNAGLYQTKSYIQKIKALFQNPKTDKKVLQDIINESMEKCYQLTKEKEKDI